MKAEAQIKEILKKTGRSMTGRSIFKKSNNKGAKEILDILHQNTTLTSLDLRSNGIDDLGAESISAALQQNTTLISLKLWDNKIGAAGAASLSAALQQNTTLTSLYLGTNGIGATGAESISAALQQNTTLTSLDLGKNGIGATGAESISAALQQNTTLTSLDLESNLIGATGAESISAALKQNTTLTSLDLGINGIGAKGAESISVALQQNTTLTSLDLGDNVLGDSGAESISVALRQNTTLTSLDLLHDGIGAKGAASLSDALKHNTTLTNLRLLGNRISDVGAASLSEALKQNTTLTSLDLERDYIGATGVASLLAALQQNTTLISLNLGINRAFLREDERDDTMQREITKLLKRNKEGAAASIKEEPVQPVSKPSPEDMYAKGYHLEFNEDKSKINVTEAVKFYKDAADLNHAGAQYALGLAYEFGKGGLTKDITKATDLYTKSAKQGNKKAENRLQEIRFAEEEKAANTRKPTTIAAPENTSNYNQNDDNNKIEQAVEQIVAMPEESKKQVLIEQTLVTQVEHEEKAIEKVIDSRNEKVEEELREVQKKLKEIGNRTDAMWAEYVKKQAVLLEQQAINTDSCPSVKIFYREVEKTLGAKLSAAINLSSGMLQRSSTKTDTASGIAGSVVGQITNLFIPGLGSVASSVTEGSIKYAKGYAQKLKYATTADIVNNVVAACELSEVVARKLTIHFRDNGNLKKMSVSDAVEEAKSLSRKVYGYIKNGEIKDNSSLESIALEIIEKVREEVNKAKPARFGMQKSSVKLAEDPNFRMLEHKVNKISEGPSGELLQKLMDRRVGDVEKASLDESAKLRAELEKQKEEAARRDKEMAEMKAMMALLMSQQQGGNPVNTAQASTAMPTQHGSASLEQNQVPLRRSAADMGARFEQNQNTR